jgi:nicotinamide mononucleotide adenylyltransferase|tara:strand:+ start:2097 stop:2291 length:195 start_codon:yes stop_codon:yes gene_type:complete
MLTRQVESSLRNAQEDLREALAFAARTEKPWVSKHIADMLANIDNVVDADQLLSDVETFMGDEE